MSMLVTEQILLSAYVILFFTGGWVRFALLFLHIVAVFYQNRAYDSGTRMPNPNMIGSSRAM